MRRTRDVILGWLIDPARLEEILGDLEESRSSRRASSQWRDVMSLALRQSRYRQLPNTIGLPLLAATASLLLLANPSPLRTVTAHDDAGQFSIRFAGREVIGATVNGVAFTREVIARDGDVVIIPTRPEPLRLRISGAAAFEWESRARLVSAP